MVSERKSIIEFQNNRVKFIRTESFGILLDSVGNGAIFFACQEVEMKSECTQLVLKKMCVFRRKMGIEFEGVSLISKD